MTDQPASSCATQRLAGTDTVAQACVHIEAAAHQLEAAAAGDVFCALLGLAGQLCLIRGGIDPTIRAAVDPNDRLGPLAHVDRALSLLGSAPACARPTDLLVWALRLADVRDALLAVGTGQP